MSKAPNITGVPVSRVPSDNLHEKDAHFSPPTLNALGGLSREHSEQVHFVLTPLSKSIMNRGHPSPGRTPRRHMGDAECTLAMDLNSFLPQTMSRGDKHVQITQ